MFTKRKIETNNAPRAIGPYSQALIVGERVYLSAQLGLDPLTMDFVSDDILEQTHQVLKNLSALLEAAESSLENVVKVEVYLTDMSYFPAVSQIFGEYFTDEAPPVRQTLGVRALPRDGKIMMSCEAIRKNTGMNSTFDSTQNSQKIAREQY